MKKVVLAIFACLLLTVVIYGGVVLGLTWQPLLSGSEPDNSHLDPNVFVIDIGDCNEPEWSISQNADANMITIEGITLEQAIKHLFYYIGGNNDPNEYLMSAELVVKNDLRAELHAISMKIQNRHEPDTRPKITGVCEECNLILPYAEVSRIRYCEGHLVKEVVFEDGRHGELFTVTLPQDPNYHDKLTFTFLEDKWSHEND